MSYLSDIKLDDRNLPPPTSEIEQERKVAIFDLLEKNTFELPEKVTNGRITAHLTSIWLSRTKDLFLICLQQQETKLQSFISLFRHLNK